MGEAIVTITYEFLESFLPPGTKVIRVNPPDWGRLELKDIDIVVQHSDLPELREGMVLPVRRVIYKHAEWEEG